LVEPQRTNLVTYSSSFDTNLPWQPYGGVVITANNTTAPDGTMNADKFSVNGVYNTAFSFAQNTAYSLSFYIKKDTATSFSLEYVDKSGPFTGGSISYNFTTQAITITQSPNSSVSGISENLPNGWIRLVITFTTNVAQNYNYIAIGFVGGSGWIWGCQLEAGSYPTSYIPTTSAAVTRNADVISKTGISALIGQGEGSVLFDFQFNADLESILMDITPNTLSPQNRLILYNPGGLLVYLIIFDNGTNVVTIASSGYSLNQRLKVGYGYKNNDVALYINGTQIGTDTSCTMPTVTLSRVDLGNRLDGTYPSMISVNLAALFPTRLTNAELATLTTL
jgi:hypothetical protein